MGGMCNKNIREALRLASQLLELADRGDLHGKDDGCAVLYGVIRDCAWKIRRQAEAEREAHRARGIWDAPDPETSPAAGDRRPAA